MLCAVCGLTLWRLSYVCPCVCLTQNKLTDLHRQIEELTTRVSSLQNENAALHSRTSILEKVLDMRNEQIQVMQETKEVGRGTVVRLSHTHTQRKTHTHTHAMCTLGSGGRCIDPVQTPVRCAAAMRDHVLMWTAPATCALMSIAHDLTPECVCVCVCVCVYVCVCMFTVDSIPRR